MGLSLPSSTKGEKPRRGPPSATITPSPGPHGENPASSGSTLYLSASSRNRSCGSETLSGLLAARSFAREKSSGR